MKIKNQITLLLLLPLLFGFQPSGKNPTIEINANYRSAELLFRWFYDLSNRELVDSILLEPGIQIMADNVRALSDPATGPLRSFREELGLFTPADTTSHFSYGTDLAWRMREKSSLLLQKIKAERLEDTVVKRALVYIPADYSSQTKCNIYFVLTGWEWGDAFVCNVRRQNGRYTISEDGEPSIVINLSLITKLYGQTAEQQSKVLNGILSHEIFHFLFADYRKRSPVYGSNRDTTMLGKLYEVIQNEGIAHYIDKKPTLLKEYGKNPDFENSEKQSFRALNEAFHQLEGDGLDETQKRELLRKASTGKYWTKYGSISGMFMAYHIEMAKGIAALKKCVRQGPAYFIRQYLALQKKESHLPALDPEFKKVVEKSGRFN